MKINKSCLRKYKQNIFRSIKIPFMNYPIASFSLHSIISRAQKALHVENINYGIQRQRNNYKKCVAINNFKYLFCPY